LSSVLEHQAHTLLLLLYLLGWPELPVLEVDVLPAEAEHFTPPQPEDEDQDGIGAGEGGGLRRWERCGYREGLILSCEAVASRS
jgi:hypothetical protein